MSQEQEHAEEIWWWDDPRWPIPEPAGFTPPYTELWGYLKAFRYHPAKAVAEWRRAAAILDALVELGEAVNSEPMTLAIIDARERAEQEIQGAREQLEALER